jgi:hypothetical protein
MSWKGAAKGCNGTTINPSSSKKKKRTAKQAPFLQIHRPFKSESAVVIDNNGVLALLLPRVIFPIFGIPLDIIPLPLLGRPPGPSPLPLSPPCCHSAAAAAADVAPPYPNGALSLLARLVDDFFGTVSPESPPPDPVVPGDETEDRSDIESEPFTTATATPTPLSLIRCRFVLLRPDGGGSHEPSSKRSIEIDPGEEGRGVDEVLSPR